MDPLSEKIKLNESLVKINSLQYLYKVCAKAEFDNMANKYSKDILEINVIHVV